MRFLTMFALALLSCLFISADVMAQGGGGGGGGGGGRGRGAGGAGGPGMLTQDPLQQVLAALGDVNLQPDFNLSKDQKEKLQAIRDDVKKAEAKWREEHAADLQKLTADAQAARQDQDQDKMREIMTKRRDLMQTQPKTDEAAAKVKALLTEDQAKALETRITEREQEMRARMGGFGGGRGGRGGAGGAGGGVQ